MQTATSLRFTELDSPVDRRLAARLLALPHIERTFWRGMSVYKPEDQVSSIYVLLKGRVKIIRSSIEGQQKILSLRYQGDLFGELALAGPTVESVRSDEAIALDSARVAVIRLADFRQAIRRDEELMSLTMQYLAARLAESGRHIESLVFDNNHRRLARLLVDLAREAGQNGESSVRLTHEELAEMIGSTREVVTAMMIEFRQRKLIDYKRGDIRPNLAKLLRFLSAAQDSVGLTEV
ncbi:MAG: Crp/Fnr family transcriptional regulator [Blastocatellales bacterium]